MPTQLGLHNCYCQRARLFCLESSCAGVILYPDNTLHNALEHITGYCDLPGFVEMVALTFFQLSPFLTRALLSIGASYPTPKQTRSLAERVPSMLPGCPHWVPLLMLAMLAMPGSGFARLPAGTAAHGAGVQGSSRLGRGG